MIFMLRANAFPIDLNMLPQLFILLRELHVSRAARTLGISQPAMSRLLEKARQSFDDNLMERSTTPGSNGYILTPLGKHLLDTLERQLPKLAAIASCKSFDPLTSERTFALSATDFEQIVLLPSVIRRIHASNNLIRIHVSHVQKDTLEQLDQNKIDVAFWMDHPPDRFSRTLLFNERLACLVGPMHPHPVKPFTMREYASCRHVRTVTHDAATGGGKSRTTFLVPDGNTPVLAPSFIASAHLSACTDMVASVPSRLAECLARITGTRVVAAPEELPPLKVFLVWNTSMDNDPGLVWLLGQICEISRDIDALPAPAPA